MSSSRPSIVLFLLAFFCSVLIPSSAVSSFSTVAIAHLSNLTVVCALVPLALTAQSELCCIDLFSRRELSYPSGYTSYSAIAAGDGFLCGLINPADGFSNATMRWWDFNATSNVSELHAKRVYWGPPLTALTSGDTHVCGLIGLDNKPKCWRWDVMQGVSPSLRFSEIAVGMNFVCGLFDNGTISCFGNETAVVGKEPIGNFSMVAAGTRHACGVSGDGQLSCWGVGGPEMDEIQLSSVVSMALGKNKSCVLLSDGTVLCWGNNSLPPYHVADEQFVSIHAMGDDVCGILLVNYSLVCWGSSLIRQNHTVYGRVLPGSCSPVTGCGCGVLPGSGEFCPAGEGICQSCKLQFSSSSSLSDQRTRRSHKTRMILIIVGSVGFGIGLSSLFIFLGVLIRKKSHGGVYGWLNRPQRQPPATQLEQPMELSPSSRLNYNIMEEFSFQELLKITDGFSEAQKIGSGGFGLVYRAKLPDGMEVAIKRAHLPSAASISSRYDQQRRREKERQRAFSSELALLSRINHKNLVRLLGFCQEPGELVLVYEYMANGTLHDHLHHRPVTPSSPLGSWSGRLRLALDAARGIEYLHAYAVPAIIHRDVKSSNILLDGEWTAKLSDFGLSLTSLEHESRAAAGTVGYMDPEYYRLQRLTAKSDVYSFGVVLLELVTGCKAVHKRGEKDDDGEGSATPKNVVEMAVPWIEADDVGRVMDRRVLPATKEELEAVAYVGYVAAECVKGEARDRPTMVEVVGALERAVAICGAGLRPALGRSESFRSGLFPDRVVSGSELAREEDSPEGQQQD